MSWTTMICPECGSEMICELDGWKVINKCTNPNCPTNKKSVPAKETNEVK